MTAIFKTEQEKFWAGGFGDEYNGRNQGMAADAGNLALLCRMLGRTQPVRSAIELGANIGLNLGALRTLLPAVELSAIEINLKAVAELAKLDARRDPN